jgi:hypothetical protein
MVFSFTHKHTTGIRILLMLILSAQCFFYVGNNALASDACAGMSCGPDTHCFNGACVQNEESSDAPLKLPSRDLTLLQPLSTSVTSLKASLGVAAGIGVLQARVGGVEVMLSGSDSGMRENGKGKIMWALAGLLMVGLAGFILRSLNPIFYT